jgi:hypothetical protein
MSLVWQAGILRQAANRIAPASRPNVWLLRSSFAWMLVTALAMLYVGGSSLADGELPTQLQFDFVRHAFSVGVLTMLIVGMAMMILPEFAAGRQRPNRQPQLAFILVALVNTAAVLRIAPSLAGTSWTFDQRNLSMAIAGSLGEAALIIFSTYFLRLRSGAQGRS